MVPKVPVNRFTKNILLVEDSDINGEIAVEMLRNLGANTELAGNGKEGVQCFENSVPRYYTLIFMDVQMPVMNGYEATRTIRALPRCDAKTIPIIAMTAESFVEGIRRAEDAGMNGNMAKPLDFETLVKKIGKCLYESV